MKSHKDEADLLRSKKEAQAEDIVNSIGRKFLFSWNNMDMNWKSMYDEMEEKRWNDVFFGNIGLEMDKFMESPTEICKSWADLSLRCNTKEAGKCLFAFFGNSFSEGVNEPFFTHCC